MKNGQISDVMRPENAILVHCEPIYEYLPGWIEDITEIRNYHDLPENAQGYLDFVESETGANIEIISVGPDREQTFIWL